MAFFFQSSGRPSQELDMLKWFSSSQGTRKLSGEARRRRLAVTAPIKPALDIGAGVVHYFRIRKLHQEEVFIVNYPCLKAGACKS